MTRRAKGKGFVEIQDDARKEKREKARDKEKVREKEESGAGAVGDDRDLPAAHRLDELRPQIAVVILFLVLHQWLRRHVPRPSILFV